MKNITSNLLLNKKIFSIRINKNDLLKKKKNLILSDKYGSNKLKKLNWYKKGFEVINVFNLEEHYQNVKFVSRELKKIIKLKKNKFNINQYHEYINDRKHVEIIKKTRQLNPEKFYKIKNKIFTILKQKYNLKFKKNEILKTEICILRLNRPGKQDMNPPHRDGSLRCWSKCINIWYMLSGNRKTSALPIVPKSHLLSENNLLETQPKSKMNSIKYNVPIIFKIKGKKKISFKIPKIEPGQVLIFSPYLIHGFGYNFGVETRSAIELRPQIKE